MESDANALGVNATMCYFPWYPYYLRYQIGFDILVNPPDGQEERSAVGQQQRLIHVRLYFPDGFYCMPANHGGLHPPALRGGASHFCPPHPHTQPPMYNPAYTHPPRPEFHQAPMNFHGPPTWPEQRDSHVIVYAVNGKPGEFMVIDDTPYDVIPKCQECTQFHTAEEHVHDRRPHCIPKRKTSHRPFKQPERSRDFRYHPSPPGATSQSGTSSAESVTANYHVTTNPENRLQNEDKPNLMQKVEEGRQYGPDDDVQEI